MKPTILKRKTAALVLSCGLLIMLLVLCGCEAFVRKFTRKPKKDDLPKEEMVLAPEEYKGAAMSNTERFKEYFLFWKSWQDELISALSPGANHKKQVECVNKAIENMEDLKSVLNSTGQAQVEPYLERLNGLKELIAKDLYGGNAYNLRQEAERIKRNILRDLSFAKLKSYLL